MEEFFENLLKLSARLFLATVVVMMGFAAHGATPPPDFSPDLSVNIGNVPHLRAVLATERAPRLVWFGDSTGADSFVGFLNWLAKHTIQGVQTGAPWIENNYGGSYPLNGSGSFAGYSDPTYYWGTGSGLVLGPGTNDNFGSYTLASAFYYANRAQLFYYSSSSNGAATLNLSTNGKSWSSYGINEASGTPEGALICTNIALPLGNWTMCLSNVSGNFRMAFLGWGLVNTNSSAGAILSDMHAGGLQLSDWLAMGSNNIMCLMTNLAPDVVVYQQIKLIPSYTNYPAFFSYMNRYGQCDVVLGAAQAGYNEVADLLQSPPVLSAYASALSIRGTAITNGYPFWDNYTPLSSWASITNLGWNLDDVIHLDSAGQYFAAQLFMRELQWPALWCAAGRCNTAFAQTLPPSSLTAKSCVLNAFVNPNGALATNYFQYGQTTSYTGTTQPAPIGSAAQTCSVAISNLIPYRIYHCRAVSVSATATNAGDDLEFFTPAAALAFTSVGFHGSNDFHLGFTGTSNVTFSLWASGDLSDWAEIATSTQLSPTNYSLDDVTPTNAGARYYQVNWP